MNNIYRLVDLVSIPTPAHREYSTVQMEAARAVMVARGLRFDDKTGITSNNNGWLSRPSGYVHNPHGNAVDVLQWEFFSHIANSASRVVRGLTP